MGRIRREVLKVEKMIERKELDLKERFWGKKDFYNKQGKKEEGMWLVCVK